MSNGRARVYGWSLALLGAAASMAAWVPACASGETNTTGGDASVGGDTGGGLPETGGGDSGGPQDTGADVPLFETGPAEVPIGKPCTATDTCAQGGSCQEITPGATYCTVDCGTGCPSGSYCTTVAGKQLCAPDLGNQCARCAGSIDCAMPTDQCVTTPLGDKFCARDCTALGDCPSGFDCVDATGYPASESGDAGVDAGSAEAGIDAGSVDASGVPRICVPSAGGSCACDAARDGVTRACQISNAIGVCTGTETCAGAAGAWQGCTARTPTAEVCNGIDDDCDGVIDNGTGNQLCSTVGPPPPNASWACSSATTPPSCQLGPCDAGFTDYPVPVDPKTGCICPVDPGEPNDLCSQPPTNLGAIASNATAPLVAKGTLSSDADVDIYAFKTTDSTANAASNVHVSIAFDATSNASGEFVFDVVHAGPCLDAPPANHSNLTTYDWCVNGSGNTRGEAPCGLVTGQNHCADFSASYYLRVHRVSGFAKPSCNPYVINITAGGGACDFTQSCETP